MIINFALQTDSLAGSSFFNIHVKLKKKKEIQRCPKI